MRPAGPRARPAPAPGPVHARAGVPAAPRAPAGHLRISRLHDHEPARAARPCRLTTRAHSRVHADRQIRNSAEGSQSGAKRVSGCCDKARIAKAAARRAAAAEGSGEDHARAEHAAQGDQERELPPPPRRRRTPSGSRRRKKSGQLLLQRFSPSASPCTRAVQLYEYVSVLYEF